MFGYIFILFCLLQTTSSYSPPTPTSIFKAGEDDHAAYRIPGIVVASNQTSTLLAFAEGRKYGCGDFDGQHNIVSKRSTDSGQTWSNLMLIADPTTLFGCKSNGTSPKGLCQFWDPTPVTDETTGAVHLLAAYTSCNDTSTRKKGLNDIFQWTTYDNGLSWTSARNITHFFSSSGYRLTPSNGHGIQLRQYNNTTSTSVSYRGRLLIPAYGANGSGVIYSDDHGITWNVTDSQFPTSAEGDVAELNNGSIIYALRMDHASPINECYPYSHCRGQAISNDGGMTFTNFSYLAALPDPACKGGLASSIGSSNQNAMLVFANDADEKNRNHVTLRKSLDGGNSWNIKDSQLLYKGTAGYVDVVANDKNAFVIYEENMCSIIISIVAL